MSRLIRRNHEFFVLSFLGLFFLVGRPVEFGQENVFFQRFLIPKPAVRIALGLNLEDVQIHASSGMKIYRVAEKYKLLAEDSSEFRVGDFLADGEAPGYFNTLNPLGFPEAGIIREKAPERMSKTQWVMVNNELVDLDEGTSLYFIPANPQSYLTYGGKNYRGIFVLRGNPEGAILINVLNLEDYLKSVVPGELSPYYFGEIEALKAQAIAARTYCLKNIGQCDALGFDLYATTRSQLYEGMSIEHPLSNRAVEETKGEVAVYDGMLINALYTSTCGGATESAEAVFGGNAVPYLQSTQCLMESERGWTLRTEGSLPSYFVGGRNVAPKIAVLAALGIFAPNGDPEWYKSPIPPEEAAVWIEKAASAVGKTADNVEPSVEPVTASAFGRWIVDAFDRSERNITLAGMSESEYATENPAGFEAEERSLRAYFLISGVDPPMTSAAPPEALTRAEAAAALSLVIDFYGTPFRRAILNRVEKNALLVADEGEIRSLDLGPNLYLLRSVEGSVSFLSSLDLEPGDAVQWIEHEGQVRLLQVQSIPLSDLLDQSSRYHRWQVRTAREDLEARLNQYYPIGKLTDLIPLKHGDSKRVIELSVIGSESQVRVTGLKIRQVLNLRDNLFVIDRETDEEGQPTHFIFSGKGWGHGVGLCQVGAFRMARTGATHEEILKKYYRGIKVEKRI